MIIDIYAGRKVTGWVRYKTLTRNLSIGGRKGAEKKAPSASVLRDAFQFIASYIRYRGVIGILPVGCGHWPVGAITNQSHAPDPPPILCTGSRQAERIIAAEGLWLPGLIRNEPKRDSCRSFMQSHIVTAPTGQCPQPTPIFRQMRKDC